MFDGLYGLFHDPIISGYHQNDQVGDVCAPGPHGVEGSVAWGVEECNLLSRWNGYCRNETNFQLIRRKMACFLFLINYYLPRGILICTKSSVSFRLLPCLSWLGNTCTIALKICKMCFFPEIIQLPLYLTDKNRSQLFCEIKHIASL